MYFLITFLLCSASTHFSIWCYKVLRFVPYNATADWRFGEGLFRQRRCQFFIVAVARFSLDPNPILWSVSRHRVTRTTVRRTLESLKLLLCSWKY